MTEEQLLQFAIAVAVANIMLLLFAVLVLIVAVAGHVYITRKSRVSKQGQGGLVAEGKS